MANETEHDWARDSNPLFTFLGLYLSTFQWIEGELDLIILYAARFENWGDTQDRLARMDNNAKVKAAAMAAIDTGAFPLVGSIEGWEARVESVTAQLHEERRRRNRIMHSQFLMEGLEHGLPAIRSVRTRGEPDRPFDQEELSRPRMDAILREVAELAFATGIIMVQLRNALPRDRTT